MALRALFIVVILPSDILSARTSFWISSPVIARLLERPRPTRSNEVRGFDTAEALFVREDLNPGKEVDIKGLAMPVASAKCWLGGGLVLATDFLLGDLGDKGTSEPVEPVGMLVSPPALVCAVGIGGSARDEDKGKWFKCSSGEECRKRANSLEGELGEGLALVECRLYSRALPGCLSRCHMRMRLPPSIDYFYGCDAVREMYQEPLSNDLGDCTADWRQLDEYARRFRRQSSPSTF